MSIELMSWNFSILLVILLISSLEFLGFQEPRARASHDSHLCCHHHCYLKAAVKLKERNRIATVPINPGVP